MSDDEGFGALLTAQIVAAWQAGERTFLKLLQRLAGPDPATLLVILRRMAGAHPWTNDLIGQATGVAEANGKQGGDASPAPAAAGAMPHPLDFDWRFTPAAVLALEGIYRPLVPPAGTVLFLGTPTLFQAALQRPVDPSTHRILIDRNALFLRDPAGEGNSRSLALDVCRDPLPEQILADVVLTDPPWYEQEMRAFLWAAAALCRGGGTVIACLPGLNARPGVEAERTRVLAWARATLGLTCLAINPARVRYRTPLFERNAWRAAGFREVGPDWRAGDVAVLRKAPGSGPVPARPYGPWEPAWHSLRFGEVVLRLRPDPKAGFADPSLIRLFPDDVLPSVSRRDARRAEVDVWSSGNRVFACQGPAVLESIGRALSEGGHVVSAVEDRLQRELHPDEKNLVKRAAGQLLVLVECERHAKPFRPTES